MKEEIIMKIVVIGGSGLIGSTAVTILKNQGHEVIAASRKSGVDAITGEGLAEALKNASVVIDVAQSPSWEPADVKAFFETSTRNLLAAESAAGVGHHVALSIVGLERSPDSGYFLAKLAQEKLIKAASIPYSIVRATQFLEFSNGIAYSATEGNIVRIPPVLYQPIAAADVSAEVARVAVGSPLNGTVEIGGPEKFRFDDFIRRALKASNDSREVVADSNALYFGAKLSERTLVPDDDARLGKTHFDEWLKGSAGNAQAAKS
jgi:uncharacterized protein YbjT (DUF2867 family)